jgi:hypothetical protein
MNEEDINFELESLPSNFSLSSTYTPTSERNSLSDISLISPTELKTRLEEDQFEEDQFEKDQFEKDQFDENHVEKEEVKEKYVWIPIDEKWQKILMSESYMIKDCAADGNCQFRSLEEALKTSKLKTSHKKLRRMVSDYILKLSDIEFQDILNNYKVEKDNGEFYGDWDPYSIKTKRQLALEVKKSGWNFEGDNMTLSILSKVLNIDIIILNQNNYNITKLDNNHTHFVILNFIQINNTGHYKTVGFKQNKIIHTLFNRQNLPDDMLSLVDNIIFYKKHIKRIYDLYDPFTCNDLILNLELLLNKLSKSDKTLVCKLSAELVSKEKAKPREKIKYKRSFPKSVKHKSKSVKRKSKSKSVKQKSKSVKRKSKSKSKSKTKSVKRKSKSKSKGKSVKSKAKSVKRKSKSVKSKTKSVKRKSKSKDKSVKSKAKSVKRKSKSVKSKSKSVKRKSKSKSKGKSVKSKAKSVKRKSKSVKSKSVKKERKSKSVKQKSKSKSKNKSVKRKRKSKKRKSKLVKRKRIKRKLFPKKLI